MSGLERRYRRLLLCYPRTYRRARADEIVSTLLELAPPGRTRPTWREAVNLLRHGLRVRLGRPASRSVVVWASLAAVLCGLFAVALGTRLGWETARPLPSVEEARAVFTDTLPGHQISGIYRAPALFMIYDQPLTWDNAGTMLTLDAGEYQLSHTSTSLTGELAFDHQQTVSTAQDRLRAAGWALYPVTVRDAAGCLNPPCDPANLPKAYYLWATRGDTVLTIATYPRTLHDAGHLGIRLTRATPWAAYPAGIIAGLLGLLAGWMVFGWASRRTEGLRPASSQFTTVLYGLTMLLWGGPTSIALVSSIVDHAREPHPRWRPMWEWLGQLTLMPVFLAGCACALLALALAALPRRRAAGDVREGRPPELAIAPARPGCLT